MARRRFQDTRPLTNEQGLMALILMGMGLTIGGVVATCFLALSEGANQGAELWLSGQCLLGSSQSRRCSVIVASSSLLALLEGQPTGFLKLLQQLFPNDQASSQQQRPALNADLIDTEIGEHVMP